MTVALAVNPRRKGEDVARRLSKAQLPLREHQPSTKPESYTSRTREYRLMAHSGNSLMRGFSAGVGSKADIDAAALTERSFMSA